MHALKLWGLTSDLCMHGTADSAGSTHEIEYTVPLKHFKSLSASFFVNFRQPRDCLCLDKLVPVSCSFLHHMALPKPCALWLCVGSHRMHIPAAFSSMSKHMGDPGADYCAVYLLLTCPDSPVPGTAL